MRIWFDQIWQVGLWVSRQSSRGSGRRSSCSSSFDNVGCVVVVLGMLMVVLMGRFVGTEWNVHGSLFTSLDRMRRFDRPPFTFVVDSRWMIPFMDWLNFQVELLRPRSYSSAKILTVWSWVMAPQNEEQSIFCRSWNQAIIDLSFYGFVHWHNGQQKTKATTPRRCRSYIR